MKRRAGLLACGLCLVAWVGGYAQQGPGEIATVAGTGRSGFSGDGGPAARAELSRPIAVAVDGKGNLYLADRGNQRVRRVDPEGRIATVAGSGNPGMSGDGGPATRACLWNPSGVAVDPRGNLYIADGDNASIRRVNPSGEIRTLAGSGRMGFAGDGERALRALFYKPAGVAVDAEGRLYIPDVYNHRVRRVTAAGSVATFAGSGLTGYGRGSFSGDGGLAIQACLSNPSGVAVDGRGTVYIADSGNHRVRKVDPGGIITTIAGTGKPGFSGDGGPAVQAGLNAPWAIALDGQGAIYIADTGNHRIRKVDAEGVITTVAGSGNPGFSGDGGPAIRADLNGPCGVAVDDQGRIYIADTTNHRVRKVSPGGMARPSIALSDSALTFDTTGVGASSSRTFTVSNPGGDTLSVVAGLKSGADASPFRVSPTAARVPPGGRQMFTVTFSPSSAGRTTGLLRLGTVQGTAAGEVALEGTGTALAPGIQVPASVVMDSAMAGTSSRKVLRISNPGNAPLTVRELAVTGPDSDQFAAPARVLKVSPGGSETVTVTFTPSGPGPRSAALSIAHSAGGVPAVVLLSGVGIWKAPDREGPGAIATLAGMVTGGCSGDGGPATRARLSGPTGVAVDPKGNVYIADRENNRVRRVDREGIVTTFAGTGTAGFSGDGGPAASAGLYHPTGLAVDEAGALYIADYGNQRIRKVTPEGTISTIAGGGGSAGDGIPASRASLFGPAGVTVDPKGNVYIADRDNHRIRRVTPDGRISTVAGTGTPGLAPDRLPAVQARIHSPSGVAIDRQGRIYFSDTGNSRVCRVNADGGMTEVAGAGPPGGSGGGESAVRIRLKGPFGVAVDGDGNLYLADRWNHRVCRVDPEGRISTFAGNGTRGYAGDGGPSARAQLNWPSGVAADSAGKVYIADTGNHCIRRAAPGNAN